jgi:hypothetical protein
MMWPAEKSTPLQWMSTMRLMRMMRVYEDN